MTTRGNPSISPPVPRQVPISGTPPPTQQLFSGQPPPIAQHHFDYITTQQQQGQTLLPYQAYGSAPNDLRANSAPGGRGGVPQGNLAPTGHYYPTNQNMRPPQPPQNAGQQYFINPQAQGGMRHQRQPAAPNQAILMLPHNNNMVISSMYQPPGRLPMYSGNPSYPPYANPAGQMVYFPNSVQRPQHMPMQAPQNIPAPRQREKRILTISDPDTGRNITDDILKNPASSEAQSEDSSVTDKGMEIRKNFTRQVAERMKTGDSAASQPFADATNQSVLSQPSQQRLAQTQFIQQQQQQHQSNQPPAPLPAVSTPSSMVRPPMSAPQQPPPMMGGPPGPPHLMNQRPGMVRPPMPPQTPPSTQPGMPINVNLSRPPPQLPNNYYENRPQQNQQPPPRTQIPPVMTGSAQPVIPHPQPQPHPHPPQPVLVEASAPRATTPADNAPSLVDQKPVESLEQRRPTSHIPSRPAATDAPVAVAEPVSLQKQQVESPPVAPIEEAAAPTVPTEAKPSEQTSEMTMETKEPTPVPEAPPAPVTPSVAPAEADPTPAPVEPQPQPSSSQEDSKDGPTAGATIQGSSKDVRKGKKNKKDFNRKDIGGSEMDAFIDAKGEQNGHAFSPSTAEVITTAAIINLPEENDKGHGENMDKRCPTAVTTTITDSTALNIEVDLEDSTSQENSPVDGVKANEMNVEKLNQVENKKSKKKKKKKGKKGAQAQPKDSDAPVQEEETASTVTNGDPVPSSHEKPADMEEKSQSLNSIGLNGEVKELSSTASSISSLCGNGQDTAFVSLERGDGNESPPNVAQMEAPSENKEAITSTSNSTSIRDAKEDSTPASTETVSAPTPPPSEAVTPPLSDPVVSEKEPPKPASPQNITMPEKSAPPKVVVPVEKEEVQVDNQKSAPETDKSENRPQSETEVKLDNGESREAPPATSVEPPAEVKSSIIKENHQAYNDENEPPKEIEKSKGENMKSADESAKDADSGLKSKKDVKDNKLQYDRAYLMELRECPSSQTKPDGLPDLDIILDRPVVSAPRMSGSAPLDFTPSFFQPTPGGQRHAQPIGKVSSRGRQRPGEMMPTQRVIKSVSIQNDLKPLHQSEKPWKPSKAADDGSEAKKTLEAEVLFIMNRLTPTNFERLAEEMKKLNISTYDDLIQVVNIFFDKATMETKFVEAYAQLCKIMSPFKVPPPPNMKENQCSFRVVMLTKCQQEFEQDKSIIFENPDEKKKKLEAENPEVTPERNEMIENVLYKLKLRRMGFYGNIRFIGELFKLNMLTEKIMHDCIFRLLRARDDDSLVSLCQLLTTVGKELDTEKAKQRMDQYFTQMSKIAEEHKSRIKFTLMDVIDLRQNHWIPRKEAVGPKKIADVHKDFAQEQARAQYLQSQPLPSRNDTPQQPGSRRGSRQRQDDKMNDDGWNTVGSKNIRMIDASKMKISKSNIVDDNIQLGPGGGMNKQPMWSRGSHGGAQMSQDDRSSAPGNRFSALRNDEDRRPFQRSPSRGDGGPASRGMRQGLTVGHGRGKIISRSSTEGERRDALASARSILGGGRSQNSSRDNSWNRDDRRMFGPRSSGEREDTSRDVLLRPNNDMRAPPAPPPAKRAPDLTTDEMESKAKNILQEYLNIRDLDEAKLCVQELTGQQLLHVLVSSSINDVLEQNDQARTNTGQYLYELLQAKLITMECYLKGLGEVLEFAEDMIIDIPKLWTYLAQTIAPILIGGFLTLSQVKTSVATYLSNRNGAILMSHIISLFAEKAGEEKVAKEASGLGWETFLKADEVETFLEDRKVGFLLRPSSASGAPATSSPSSGVSMEQIAADLENLMRSNASNLDLTAFIERLPAGENKEKNIVRALMTAIGNASRPDFKSTEEVIKKRKDLLSKVMGTKMDLQLQALYSIQALMTQLEHPRDVMDRFFTALYEEDVIELEAFGRWHKSSDPQEQHGKGVSVLQLKQFFTDLKEDGLILS